MRTWSIRSSTGRCGSPTLRTFRTSRSQHSRATPRARGTCWCAPTKASTPRSCSARGVSSSPSTTPRTNVLMFSSPSTSKGSRRRSWAHPAPVASARLWGDPGMDGAPAGHYGANHGPSNPSHHRSVRFARTRGVRPPLTPAPTARSLFVPAISHVRSVAVPLAAGLALLVTAGPASAHQQWFVNDPDAYPVDLQAMLRPGVLIGIAAAIAVTLVWRAVAARLMVPELGFFSPARRLTGLVPWVSRLLAAHLGISLLILAFDRAVLDPGIHVPDGAGGTLLLVPQAVVGALLIAGVLVRSAAIAVMIAGSLPARKSV